VTDVHPDEIDAMEKALRNNEVNPRDLKMKLAFEIARLYHGEKEAIRAEENFISVFRKKGVPDDIAEYRLDGKPGLDGGIDLTELLTALGFCASKSEARRFISQGAVRINGEKVSSLTIPGLNNGDVIQAGKLKFARILR
jgi:tyrosyl-tRNA synthetase